METSTFVLMLRVLLSLACVLGLVWYAGRRMSGSAAGRAQRAAAMTVVARQSLGGRTGLALVDVAGRRLLLGVGENGVNLLTEVDVPADADAADGTRGHRRTPLDPEQLAQLAIEASPTVDVPSALSGLDGADLPSSTPAARTPAVTEPRNPLEGSVLDAATWRRAMVAVQERTIRR